MPTLFVAGTGTDVGKTYVSARLIEAWREAGVPVEALKPVVSGFDPADPGGSDPDVLLRALGRPFSPEALDQISPLRYRAPLSPPLAASLEGKRLDGQAILDLCRARAEATAPRSWLLVESAGGIMSPLDETWTMLELAIGLGAPVLLVAGTYLGTISHILTAAAVIASSRLRLAGVALSASGGENPDIGPTLDALSRRLARVPFVTLPRNGRVAPADLERFGLV